MEPEQPDARPSAALLAGLLDLPERAYPAGETDQRVADDGWPPSSWPEPEPLSGLADALLTDPLAEVDRLLQQEGIGTGCDLRDVLGVLPAALRTPRLSQ